MTVFVECHEIVHFIPASERFGGEMVDFHSVIPPEIQV